MKPTVGATLQGGKYAIQEVVTQNDGSITYKAAHTYLDQIVLLQTFSEAVQQQPDFAQLAQQFIERVRHLAKQPVANHFHVLDCFKEGELPFLVLEFIPDRLPLPLSEWFACSPHADEAQTKPLNSSNSTHSPALAVTPAPVISDTLPTAVKLTGVEPDGIPAAQAHPEAETILPSESSSSADRFSQSTDNSGHASYSGHPPIDDTKLPLNLPSGDLPSNTDVPGAPSNGLRNGSNSTGSNSTGSNSTRYPNKTVTVTIGKATPVKQSKQKAQLPIALMVMALVGGSVGAGMGVAMRVSTASNPQSSKPRINLFNREQSFPPTQDWPVQEEAVYTPQPAIEQPLYRTPVEDYTPSVITPPVIQPALPPETTALPEPIYTPAETPEPPPIEPPAELPPPKSKSRLEDPVPPAVEAPLPEIPPAAIDAPPPMPELIAPPPVVAPEPILPPTDVVPAAPPISKPLPNNSRRTTL